MDKKITKKNIPYKDDVYFEKLLSNALYDYSFKWDGPINSYLRYGDVYFYTTIFKETFTYYGDTKKSAAEAIKNKIIDLDRAFLEAAPRHEDSTKIYYRGMKEPFKNFKDVGDSITVFNYMSITTNLKVAVGFSGIGKVGLAKCCVYKLVISNGVPYVNMINTTKYKHENETLLPRNLKLTLINKEILPFKFNGEIPLIVIKVSLQSNDQFKIHSGCKKFYIGKLISVKSSYLDLITKSNSDNITSEKQMPKKVIKEKNNIAKKQTTKRERCPNGTRKNKITGLCDGIPTSKQEKSETKTLKQKANINRCPNGTRRNKITGLCEKK